MINLRRFISGCCMYVCLMGVWTSTSVNVTSLTTKQVKEQETKAKSIFNLSGTLTSLKNTAKKKAVEYFYKRGPEPSSMKGKYRYEEGVINVTADSFMGLPTGHAGILVKKKNTWNIVEATSKGVVTSSGNWFNKKTLYQVSVKKTSLSQDKKAADWCVSKVNKKYNYNYFNIGTRSSFYCSHLIYAAFMDNFHINLNTTSFKSILGDPIHPLELVASKETRLIYRK